MQKILAVLISIAIASPLNAQPAARQFVPLVEWRDTAAVCEVLIASLRAGERGHLLRFSAVDSSSRVVTAVWDSTGTLRRYSDSRGDLRPHFVAGNALGPQTGIAIDFVNRIALLTNSDRGQDRGTVGMAASEALELPMFGPPRRLLARLHDQCGAPAFGKTSPSERLNPI